MIYIIIIDMSIERSCRTCEFNGYICPNDHETLKDNDFGQTLLIDFALNAIRNCKNCFCKGSVKEGEYCYGGNANNCSNWKQK